MTPVERIEALYQELLTHYADGEDREIRAAAKLLLVALDRFRRFGGPNWGALVNEYLDAAMQRPEEFEAMLRSNRAPPEQFRH